MPSTRAVTYPNPMASRWDSRRDGRKTLRNSAEKMPPFFMTLVFRMLSVGARFGRLKRRNSLGERCWSAEACRASWAKAGPRCKHSLGRGHVFRPAGPIPNPV